MKNYKDLSELSTGLQREVRKAKPKINSADIAKLFNITADGARKKINKNSFTVEEAIVIMVTFYNAKDLDFNKMVEMFTYKSAN